MSKVSFTLSPDWTGAIKDELEELLYSCGEQGYKHARRMVPYDTGELHDSIDYEVNAPVSGQDLGSVVIYADTEYALFVEVGTENTPAQPYLRPALDAMRGEFK